MLGRTERSSPYAAWRRGEGAGLDRESADRAIISPLANVGIVERSGSIGQEDNLVIIEHRVTRSGVAVMTVDEFKALTARGTTAARAEGKKAA